MKQNCKKKLPDIDSLGICTVATIRHDGFILIGGESEVPQCYPDVHVKVRAVTYFMYTYV